MKILNNKVFVGIVYVIVVIGFFYLCRSNKIPTNDSGLCTEASEANFKMKCDPILKAQGIYKLQRLAD